MVCLSNHFAGLAVGGVMSLVIVTSFIIFLCVIMKRRRASKWSNLTVLYCWLLASVHHDCVVVMCCLFIVRNSEHIFTGNMATLDTQRGQMDIKMNEAVVHEYEDVAHEYEDVEHEYEVVTHESEVPFSMIKMKECETYATLPYQQ